jgi:hypothetical protein
MRKGQVWLETVVYTLIGLSLIALVLAIITPRINEQRDRAVIEQTIASLNALDSKVREATSAPGNVRIVEFNLRRGDIYIDGVDNKIYFELTDSRSLFSEPGVSIPLGRVNVTTTEGARHHTVRLELGYQNINMTYAGQDRVERMGAAGIPYRIRISHEGFQSGNPHIDIRRS